MRGPVSKEACPKRRFFKTGERSLIRRNALQMKDVSYSVLPNLLTCHNSNKKPKLQCSITITTYRKCSTLFLPIQQQLRSSYWRRNLHVEKKRKRWPFSTFFFYRSSRTCLPMPACFDHYLTIFNWGHFDLFNKDNPWMVNWKQEPMRHDLDWWLRGRKGVRWPTTFVNCTASSWSVTWSICNWV